MADTDLRVELRTVATRLATNGYRALPCRCRDDHTVGVDYLHNLLTAAADALDTKFRHTGHVGDTVKLPPLDWPIDAERRKAEELAYRQRACVHHYTYEPHIDAYFCQRCAHTVTPQQIAQSVR